MTPQAPEVGRLRARWQRLLAVVAMATLPWLVAPGLVQPDTKLDLTVSPWRYLERATHAWSGHNGVGELQNQAYGYLFPMGPFHGVLISAGLPEWAVQRLWWTLVLVVALLGADRLIRRLGVAGTVPPLVGAAVYALSPRVLTMLTESSVELWPYALAPWLVVVTRSATGPAMVSGRVMAVRTAALVVCLGGVNATVNLFALMPAALWLVVAARGRARWRLLAWWCTAVLAGSLWWLAPLLVLGRYSYPFLDFIEQASTTTGVTTVVNVLRGADHWIAYLLTDAGHPVWQSGWVLAQSVVAVLATCALAAAGLAGLRAVGAQSRSTADDGGLVRRWAVVCLLLGVVVMGVGRSGTAAGPLAETVRSLLDGPLAPLRNVHKADLLVRLPVALGVAAAAAWLGSWDARGAAASRARAAGVVALTLALVGSVLPLWQGRVADAWGYPGVPLSVRQTATDIDAAAAEAPGSTMVLPASRMAHQSWGRTNDEPLRALAQSPVVARAAAPLGHPGATRLMDRVDRLASSGRPQPDLVSALRRLGVARVVVRYDITEDEATLDPFVVEQTLEATPGIDFVRTRGAGDGALTQWSVTPQGDTVDGVRSDPADSVPVVVASPEGVVDLEAAGLVAPGRATVLARDAGPLGRGPDVVTDTLRWQLYNAGRPAHLASSPTVGEHNVWPATSGTRALPPGDDVTGAATRTWPGYQGVQVSSSNADPFGGGRGSASSGPASLVDGDLRTTWLSAPGDPRPTVTLEPEEPLSATTSEITITVPEDESRPGSLGVRLGRSDGTTGFEDEVPVPASGPTVRLSVPSGYDRLEIVAVRDEGHEGPVGIREVDLGGGPGYPPSRRAGTALTLPAAPGATAALLTRDPRAAAQLSQGEDPASLRRSISGLSGPVSTEVVLRPRPGTALEALLDRGWDLEGSSRSVSTDLGDSIAGRPGAAVDGDPATTWVPPAGEASPRLHVDLGSVQQVDGIRLVSGGGGLVKVRTDGGTWMVPSGQGLLDVPAGPTRTVELTFTRRGDWVAPEVEIVGPARPAEAPVTLPCGEAGRLRVDGQEMRLEATVSPAGLRSGALVTARTCDEVPEVDPEGTAVEVVAGEALAPERAVLRTAASPPVAGPPATAPATARPVEEVTGPADRRTIRLGEGDASLVTTDQGANAGWQAVDEDGRPLRPVTVDGWRQAFVVPEGPATSVTLSYAPSSAHRAGLVAGGALAVLVLLLGLGSLVRRRGEAADRSLHVTAGGAGTVVASARPGPPLWVGVVLAALVGILVAGPLGLVVAAVGALVPRPWRPTVIVAALVGAGCALAALGAADRHSTGALVAQVLGALVLGVLSSLPAREPGRPSPRPASPAAAPGAAEGAPAATTTPPPEPS